jgi:hypothetical protein
MVSTKKEFEILADAMDSVPKKDYTSVRHRIMSECKVEYYIITNWRNGRSRIPDEAKAKIEKIFGRKIFSGEEQS